MWCCRIATNSEFMCKTDIYVVHVCILKLLLLNFCSIYTRKLNFATIFILPIQDISTTLKYPNIYKLSLKNHYLILPKSLILLSVFIKHMVEYSGKFSPICTRIVHESRLLSRLVRASLCYRFANQTRDISIS